MVGTQKEFASKLGELETKFAEHDKKFTVVFEAIRELMQPTPVPPKRRIGFAASQEDKAMNVTDQNTAEERVHERQISNKSSTSRLPPAFLVSVRRWCMLTLSESRFPISE